MAVDERRRSELFEGLAAVIGPEAAVTMFELLPPQGSDIATRADLELLRAEMTAGFARQDERIDSLRGELESGQASLRGELETGLAAVRAEMETLRSELIAAFRGELVAAVSGQVRTILVAVVTLTLGLAGLALTFAQLL